MRPEAVRRGQNFERCGVTDPHALSPLHDALTALHRWLVECRVPYVIVGGVAAAVLGRPRFTRDVDAMVQLSAESWPEVLRKGEPFGFVARIPDALEFAHRSRVLLLRHFPSHVDVDMMLALLPLEEAIIRDARILRIAQIDVPFPAPEDLFIMKAIAGRPRDLADLEGILDANSDLDRNKIVAAAARLSELLESPELMERVRRLLTLSQE